jgi:putative ABC transport system substrate-binding protein
MRRRDFVKVICGTAAAWPLAARAQQPPRRPVVAVTYGGPRSADISGPNPAFPPARAFVDTLRNLGWIDGRTVDLESRTAEGRPERAPDIIAEFMARGVDVIVVGATDWLLYAALKATRTVPLIAIFNEDPVALGLVRSLARPGGNLTGVTTAPGRLLVEKRLELLKELAPRVARVAFLGRRPAWESYRSEAGAAVLPLVFAPADSAEELGEAFAAVLRERADALLISHGPVMFYGAPRIAAFAAERLLPAVYPWREAVQAGGLLSYGPVVEGHFRRMAELTDKILKGTKPADMPVEQPTRFETVVNLKTAKALGLKISESFLLLRADEVIE